MTDHRLLVQIATYNTNLQAERGLPQDLVDWLAPTLQVSTFLARERRAPDIVAVGFQELLPLHLGREYSISCTCMPQWLMPVPVSGLSSQVIESRNALILSQIEEHAPNKEKYTLVAKVVNVGVALLVYARDEGVGRLVQDVQTQWTGCGPLFMGNKGAVGVRFRVPSDGGGVGEVYTYVRANVPCTYLTIACFVPLASCARISRRMHTTARDAYRTSITLPIRYSSLHFLALLLSCRVPCTQAHTCSSSAI